MFDDIILLTNSLVDKDRVKQDLNNFHVEDLEHLKSFWVSKFPVHKAVVLPYIGIITFSLIKMLPLTMLNHIVVEFLS